MTCDGGYQAIAAIGQCELVALWDKLFSLLGQPVAQVLLTRNDIVDVSSVVYLLLYRSYC